jgi:hypothetical protein
LLLQSGKAITLKTNFHFSLKENATMVKKISTLNLLFFLVLCCGCAHISSQKEPSVIIVRNSSGEGIAFFTLKSIQKSGTRYGTISPVPRGASQVFVRPSSPPALPKRLEVEWGTDSGIHNSKVVSFEGVLKSNGNQQRDTLVFEILPNGLVNVYLEE